MERRDGEPAVVTRTVRRGSCVRDGSSYREQGSPRRVASNRPQGATPAAIVEFVSIERRVTYPATQPFTVEDDQ